MVNEIVPASDEDNEEVIRSSDGNDVAIARDSREAQTMLTNADADLHHINLAFDITDRIFLRNIRPHMRRLSPQNQETRSYTFQSIRLLAYLGISLQPLLSLTSRSLAIKMQLSTLHSRPSFSTSAGELRLQHAVLSLPLTKENEFQMCALDVPINWSSENHRCSGRPQGKITAEEALQSIIESSVRMLGRRVAC
ncbi:hypothetical protein PROFUN_15785 [Planoprotostelium fungivorum]|uniref:Uncharacterized protein n=1 Tax=Planoprotostelium fungivorum TaxID=1890364 RepID=A0A2P6MT46_9EUKA|nr:hypothetical protein PROFUN_15785 [Planoprotostelium fungivorum]